MDPNEALRELRHLMASYEYDRDRAAELFNALDGWIFGGGFLPRGWEPKARLHSS